MKSCIFLFFVLLLNPFFAQRANTWYFGANAGLNFNTTPPTALSSGQVNIPDNSSTISDKNGNLLFYTTGTTVWNKNHVPMPNGTGLTGNYTAGQCALIIPNPCDSMKYIIFQTTEFASPGQLHYSVVDMSLNNGLGGVVNTHKNISLGSGWTEQLCAIYNPAGHNYWLLTHKWGSNQFVAFNINSASIATQSVVTSIGSTYNCGTYSAAHDAMGQLTISRDGQKVAVALTCQDKFELFDFNLATGVLSNAISLPAEGKAAWGTAFSPDSKKLYTNSIFGQSIFQYDLTNFSFTAILSSKVTLVTVTTGGYNFGYMELGPDNKVYIARPGTTFLSVVNSPNLSGSSSNFSLAGVTLNSQSTHGISRIAYNIPATIAPALTVAITPSVICPGQFATLSASGVTNYSWSTNSNAPTITVSPAFTTVYSFTGAINQCSVKSTHTVNVSECINLTEKEINFSFSVYPNPFQNIITIDALDFFPQSIYIYNIFGELVYQSEDEHIISQQRSLSLDHLSVGIYFLSTDKNAKRSVKLIKAAD